MQFYLDIWWKWTMDLNNIFLFTCIRIYVSTYFLFALLLLFNCSVMSDCLWTHGLQHAWLPCPSPSPRACSNPSPFNRWCHPTISSSVITLSSCLLSFPASGSFIISQLFISGGQSIGASAAASVLPVNIKDWFPLELTGLIPFTPKDSQESSTTQQFKSINSSVLSLLHGQAIISIHDYWKNHSFD